MEKYVKVLLDLGFSKMNDFRYEKSVNKEGRFERVSVAFSPLDPDKIFVHITGVHEKKSGYFFEKEKNSAFFDSKLKKTNVKKFSTYIKELCEETPVISKDDPIDSVVEKLLSSGFIFDEKLGSYIWRDRYHSLHAFTILPDRNILYSSKKKYSIHQQILELHPWSSEPSSIVDSLKESVQYPEEVIEAAKRKTLRSLREHPNKESISTLLEICYERFSSVNIMQFVDVDDELCDHGVLNLFVRSYDFDDKEFVPYIKNAFSDYLSDGRLKLRKPLDPLALQFPLTAELSEGQIELFKEIVDKLEVTINNYYEEYTRTNV